MTERPRDGFDAWLDTPPGRYLLAWEQAQLDRAVADIFGFHALQLGVPGLDALRANRMPHRWLAIDSHRDADAPTGRETRTGFAPHAPAEGAPRAVASLCCRVDALPFKTSSLDLVVLPHTLEMAHDPHETLREVERVLVPEGRLVICGFNSASLWGTRQRLGQLRLRLGGRQPLFLPRHGELIGYRRLRDWLRLMSLEVERGRFGCYAPAMRTEAWLQRMAWMDKTGDRWWPVFGAVYVLVAVKRVRGMRLVGLARRDKAKVGAAPAVVTNRAPRHAPSDPARGVMHEDIEA
jgi:SAM-dependent methyltransferase